MLSAGVLEILAAVPFAFWVLLELDRARAWPHEAVLPKAPAPGRERSAAVVAVVPARDEADVLPQTLPTLLAQRDPEIRVVLVDDDSSDGTAATAERLAAETGASGRLRVVAAPPRSAGWSGKVHAMSAGVDAVPADAEWLLFTDADIRHRPGSVASLLAEAERGGYDLVSVMARLRTENAWEKLLIPPFVYFFQLLYPFRRVRDPRSRVAAAAGGCMLVRRAALERAGGMAAIRGALIDDVALGRAIKRPGSRTWLGFDAGIESARGYDGLGGIWRMVARTAFDQLGYRWDVLALVVVGIAWAIASPPFLLLAGLSEAARGGGQAALAAAGMAAAAWALETKALAPSVRHHGVPIAWAATLPFASIFYALMTAGSAWNHARGAGGLWKGRVHGAGGSGRVAAR